MTDGILTGEELRRRLVESLGADVAGALMERLPPEEIRWGDLATRQDLRELRSDTRRDLEGLERRMTERLDDRLLATRNELVAVFRQELGTAVQGQTRTMLFSSWGPR